jgi:transposase
VDVYVGIDVHLKNWKVALQIGDLTFSTFSQPPDPETLFKYLRKNFPGGIYHLAYEAGFCGFWIYRYFKEKGINCIVVNPADIPTSDSERRKKEDRRDCRKIARELSKNGLKAIHIPSVKTQEDRLLLRTRQRLVWDLTRCKTRIKSALYFQGIHIPTQYKSSSTHWSNPFTSWLEHLEWTQESGKKAFELMLTEVKHLRAQLLLANRIIRKMSQSETYQDPAKLLLNIPGIGLITTMILLTEIEDIHRFKSIDQICSFVGLIPSMDNSDDTVKETQITPRNNRMLRTLLIESAWVAIRRDPALVLKYHRLSYRMKPNQAIVRIAKKLLKRVYHVLKHQEEYERAAA